MKKAFLLLVIITVFSASIRAQEFPESLMESLQNVLDEQTNSVIKGASVCVIMPDNSEWVGVSGIAKSGDPVNTERTWSLGSQVKSLMGTVILKMHDDGLLSIDDPISDYLDPIPNVDGATTLKSLMNHTSGLGEYWEPSNASWGTVFSNRSRVWSIPEVLQYIPVPFSNNEPTHQYVNTGTILLGLVVEAITGKHASAVMDEMLFTPLGMEYSKIPVSTFDASELNGIWNYNSGSPFDQSGQDHTSYITSRYSFIGKIEEATRFIHKRVKGELYSQGLVDMALVKAPGGEEIYELPSGKYTVNYGLNFSLIDNAGLLMVGHGGTGLSQSLSFHFPDHGFSIGLVNNVFGSTNENAGFYQLLIDEVVAYLAANPTGLDHKLTKKELRVYPNPVHGQINLSIELKDASEVSAEIYDLQGRMVEKLLSKQKASSGQFEQSIDLIKEHPEGVYILMLKTNSEVYTKKVVVK